MAQSRFKRRLQLADLQQRDATARPSEATAELHRVTAESDGQTFIKAAEGAMQGGDHAGAHPIGAVGIEVDLEGVATGGGMASPLAPVGTRIIAIDDRALRRVVEADVQPPPQAERHHPAGHLQIPVELIADAWLHRPGAMAVHRLSGGAGACDPLGVSVTRQHQNRHINRQSPCTDPITLQTAAGPGERITAFRRRCWRLSRSGTGQGKSQQASHAQGTTDSPQAAA